MIPSENEQGWLKSQKPEQGGEAEEGWKWSMPQGPAAAIYDLFTQSN